MGEIQGEDRGRERLRGNMGEERERMRKRESQRKNEME